MKNLRRDQKSSLKENHNMTGNAKSDIYPLYADPPGICDIKRQVHTLDAQIISFVVKFNTKLTLIVQVLDVSQHTDLSASVVSILF